ncbi:Surfactin synthase thioesterase subunit [Mycobacterium rhizamassiliense]|jgi:surfactin synthase thioesterase subunit|uniref:Thioesterase TesA n=1 Tax=Mycobacterium rhizamassiliense TaxID=1841860 RepID=A0A2U3P1I6_9MYCO|nr:Surfactin synthase thioesterase subunit [Mycobacterium rhizamassiliense]
MTPRYAAPVNGPHDPGKDDVTPPTLFIFPHAGGSTTFYVPFAKAFSPDMKRIAIQYPGKSDRGLTQLSSIPDLAEEIFTMMTPAVKAAGQVAFFGHSMGGLVAFEVALRFQAAGYPIGPLFISSCAAPGHIRYKELQGSDHDILNLVAQVTETDPERLANDEFASNINPTLQSVRAIANYTREPDVKVSCPIHAFVGDDDLIVASENMTAWADRTTEEFSLRVFPGDHFYLNSNLPELVKEVEGRTLDRSANS